MSAEITITSLRDIPRLIERRYKTGKEKLTMSALHEIQEAVYRYLATLPMPNRRRQEIVMASVLKELRPGMTAIDAYRHLRHLTRMVEVEELPMNQDASVMRLERQLQDLRQLVSSPVEIERKIRDLQEQVQTIRDNDEGVALTERQDDMLQHFIKSDKKAFIIMPFQRDFDNVWFGAIKPACSELKYAPLRVDEVNLLTCPPETGVA